MNQTVDGQAAAAYPHLASPFEIATVRLRNRFVFQPHFTALGGLDGMPSLDHAAYHAARAEGGAALIVFESQAVHPTGKMSGRFVHAWDPAVVPHYAPITEGVHRHGSKIFSQLTHAGHTTLVRPPQLLWAPSEMAEPSSHFVAKAMDMDDIAATIEGFALGAKHADQGGFDGIEIKIAHDGLLRSFASPYFNHRTDAYGGSFANRMRLSIEVLDAIKTATKGRLPIGVRLCLDEFTPFGYGLDYGLEMASHLEASGLVDYFNCDAGSFSSFWMEIPPAAVTAGIFNDLNRALKAQSKRPIIAFGRIAPPRIAEDILASGAADLIGFARQFIADPATANKLLSGQEASIRSCVACNDGCIFQVSQELPIRCIHNPAAGRERAMAAVDGTPPTAPKKVVVVGGGPAGMKVAEIARSRGHEVTLLERNPTLGGLVNLAARQPEHAEIGGVTAYLEAAIRRLGVAVHTSHQATAQSIAGMKPDVLVLATGSEPNFPVAQDRPRSLAREVIDPAVHVTPAIKGLNLPFVYSSDEVMSGAVQLSGSVVVYDNSGHWEGAGTAEFLCDGGCQVTIVCPSQHVAGNLEAGNRTLFYRRAAIKNIAIRTGLALDRIDQEELVFRPVYGSGRTDRFEQYMLFAGDQLQFTAFDAVVVVNGRRSRSALYHKLRAMASLSNCRIERVGDCVAPRLIEANILEAHLLAATF